LIDEVVNEVVDKVVNGVVHKVVNEVVNKVVNRVVYVGNQGLQPYAKVLRHEKPHPTYL